MNWLRSLYLLLFYAIGIPFSNAQTYVACIGDSVTKGYGIKDEKDSYPSQLKQLLGADFIVGNFGHSGATLLNKGHNPYIKTQAYQDALAFKADIVIIALGLNDTDPRNWPNYKNEFVKDYSSLIESFRSQNPNLKVYVCSMTPIFSGHRRFLSGTREWYDQIQNLIPSIAKTNKASFIDNYAVLAPRIDLFEDFLHPNAKGARLIAEHVYRYLRPIQQPLQIDKSFGSHMVLQRGRVNTLKGIGTANKNIQVHFNKQRLSTQVDSLGNWSVSLAAMPAGGPYTIDVLSEDTTLKLEDIWFGDVYLSSGQSNMAFPFKSAVGTNTDIAEASKYAQIRLFRNKNLVATNNVAWEESILEKVNDLAFFEGHWELCSPTSVADFSAVAYSFAQQLSQSLKERVPIGIIDISVGGSNLESWMPRKFLENDNVLSTYIHSWRQSDFIQDFCRERGAKNLEKASSKLQRHPYDPAYNFEAGISKWKHVQLAGVLWYQGESNAHNIEHHDYLFPKFIQSWREAFQQDLPFYFVQLSSINRTSWPYFRDAQRHYVKNLKQVYMAPSYDVGDSLDVHPTEKKIIGKRLADLALKHQYKYDIQADSPQPNHITKMGTVVEISFDSAKELKTKNHNSIIELEAMMSNGDIIPVLDAKIIKNKIIINNLPKSVQSVLYAYKPFSRGNLINEAGVPVSTFSLTLP